MSVVDLPVLKPETLYSIIQLGSVDWLGQCRQKKSNCCSQSETRSSLLLYKVTIFISCMS